MQKKRSKNGLENGNWNDAIDARRREEKYIRRGYIRRREKALLESSEGNARNYEGRAC